MTNTIISKRLEYLSLLLVISFVVFHNISIVLIGIALSLYIINKKLIDECLEFIISKTNFSASNKKISLILKKALLIDKNKDNSQISLVEAIEESGYIPSIEKNTKQDAA